MLDPSQTGPHWAEALAAQDDFGGSVEPAPELCVGTVAPFKGIIGLL